MPGIFGARDARLRALDRRLRDLQLQLRHHGHLPALHLRRRPARHPGRGQRDRDDALQRRPWSPWASRSFSSAGPSGWPRCAPSRKASRVVASEVAAQRGARGSMESASAAVPAGAEPGEKGLKSGALGYLSNLVIASPRRPRRTASRPRSGSSSRSTGMGFHAPAVMIVSFIPMLLIASAYNYMNKADPDCGTSFTWVTRAMGPRLGWLTGWAIVVADVVVMATLAYIAGVYTFLLFGLGRGARLDARVSIVAGDLDRRDDLDLLRRDRALGAHPVLPARRSRSSSLALFAVVALIKVYSGTRRPASMHLAPRLVLAIRAPGRHHRPDRRRPARGVHLLGLGLRRVRQRGVRGQPPTARARPRC